LRAFCLLIKINIQNRHIPSMLTGLTDGMGQNV
jgi:hypothetical protein